MPAWEAVNTHVPVPTSVTELPETMQILDALLVEKVKAVRPLVELAVSVIGADPKLTGEDGAKLTVWFAVLMTTLALADALA